jgi:molybdopterin molybdotransferase
MRYPSRAADDVRMRGFAQRHTVEAALGWLDAQLQPPDAEDVPLRHAAGRVLATSVVSTVDVPGFDRATMDGYALIAESTEGASAYNRLLLTVIGDSMPGCPFDSSVSAGQAVRVMTGAPMPRGADAVLPAEWVEAEANCISALAAVSPEKNVGRRGEDILSGATLLEPGRVLRPQDLGVLSSIGHGCVRVVRRPRVRLVVTGNELLPSGSRPQGFQIADANGPMLAALIERDGGVVDFPGLVRDDRDAILEALEAGSLESKADVIVVTGGSSVGIEDLAPMLVAQLGELAVHGIAMRPSSPTGLGRIGHRLVFLLPGNPVSALCAYDFFAGRAIRALGGRSKSWPYRTVRGALTRKISSPIGRLDYARVRLVDEQGRKTITDAETCAHSEKAAWKGGCSQDWLPHVEPVAIGGASVLSSTTRADGFVIVGDDSEGFAAGAEVEVWMYD